MASLTVYGNLQPTIPTKTLLFDLSIDVLQNILDQPSLSDDSCPATALLLVHCGNRRLAHKIFYGARTLILCPNEARRPHPIGTLSWCRLPWRDIRRLAFHGEIRELEVLATSYCLSSQRLRLLYQLSLTCQQYLHSLARLDLKNYNAQTKFEHLRGTLDAALPMLKTLELIFYIKEDFSAVNSMRHPLIFPTSMCVIKLSTSWISDGRDELFNINFIQSVQNHASLTECRIVYKELSSCPVLGISIWMNNEWCSESFKYLVFEMPELSKSNRRHLSAIITEFMILRTACRFRITIESVSFSWYFSSPNLTEEHVSNHRHFAASFDKKCYIVTSNFLKAMQQLMPNVNDIIIKQEAKTFDRTGLLQTLGEFSQLRHLTFACSLTRASSGELYHLPPFLLSIDLKIITCGTEIGLHELLWSVPSRCESIILRCNKSLHDEYLLVLLHYFNPCAKSLRQLTLKGVEIEVKPETNVSALTVLESLVIINAKDSVKKCVRFHIPEFFKLSMPVLQKLVIDNAHVTLMKNFEFGSIPRIALYLSSLIRSMMCCSGLFLQIQAQLQAVTNIYIPFSAFGKNVNYSLPTMFPSLHSLTIVDNYAQKGEISYKRGTFGKLLSSITNELPWLEELRLPFSIVRNEWQHFFKTCFDKNIDVRYLTKQLIIQMDDAYLNIERAIISSMREVAPKVTFACKDEAMLISVVERLSELNIPSVSAAILNNECL
jgi:hypothetical protein